MQVSECVHVCMRVCVYMCVSVSLHKRVYVCASASHLKRCAESCLSPECRYVSSRGWSVASLTSLGSCAWSHTGKEPSGWSPAAVRLIFCT